jgi:lipid-A-disaccharide synthase
MVVFYRVSRFTELISRLLVRIPRISLPNIVAGRDVVPELLQTEVTGTRLSDEARRLLAEPGAAAAQRAAFAELRSRLGEPGVGRRAARAVLASARAA